MSADPSTVSVAEFLNTIFPADDLRESETVVLTAAKAGTEQRPLGSFFNLTDRGPDWPEATKFARAKTAGYFCISTVAIPGEGEQVRRRDRDWKALFCVVLDDINTKARRSAATPTWVMETSKGNQQHGFLITPMDRHPERLDAFLDAAIAAGLTDPGCKGRTRVVRLPGSINLKPQHDGFRARLIEWNPSQFYPSLEALAEAMGLAVDWTSARDTVREQTPRKAPPGTTDPLLTWLGEQGMVLAEHPNDDGWLSIVCPWSTGHSDKRVEAGYNPIGYGTDETSRAFKCFHGSCEGRRTRDLMEWAQGRGFTQEKAPIALTAFDSLALTAAMGMLPFEEFPDIRHTADGALAQRQPPTFSNMRAIFDTCRVSVRLNMMTGKIETVFPVSTEQNTALGDAARLTLVEDMFERHRLPRTEAARAIEALGSLPQARYHPVEDWVKPLRWDGKPRIQSVADTLVVPSEYVELRDRFVRRFFIQAMEAACGWRDTRGDRQMGYVLVLSGAQGIGKTTWITRLLPSHLDAVRTGVNLDLTGYGAKDAMITALAGAIVELGEIEHMFGQANISRLKAFLTAREDSYRPPYARTNLTRPRSCVFVGSVNHHEFLTDDTGNRRFWVLPVTEIKRDEFDHEQVWAEAYSAWCEGEQYHPTAEEAITLVKHNEQFRSIDRIEDKITAHLSPIIRAREVFPNLIKIEYLRVTDILERYNLPTGRVDLQTCGRVLRQHGLAVERNKVDANGVPLSRCFGWPSLARELTEDERKRVERGMRAIK